MKTGMARVIKYQNFTPPSEIAKHEHHDPHLHDHWYYSGRTLAATNQAQLFLKASQTWNEWELNVEGMNPAEKSFDFKEKWEWEGDALYRRWFNNYLNLILGGTHYHEKSFGMLGVGYLLPMLIETQLFVNHEGKWRLDLEKHFQWTTYFFY